MNNKIIKAIGFAALMAGFMNNAYAVATGGYFGFEGGLSSVNTPSITFPDVVPRPTTSPSSTGFGFRIYMGNLVAKWFAFELGIARYAPSTYSPTSTLIVSQPQIHVNSVDLSGKFYLPIPLGGACSTFSTLGLFLKAGMAAVFTGTAGSIVNYGQAIGQTTGIYAGNSTSIRPLLGVGASLDLTQTMVADLTATQIQPTTNVPRVTFYSIGVSYHFVDVYCGQFLC
jgi:hypothetical protein